MIRLHYSPGAASLAPHLVLKELGLPHELVLVDQALRQQFDPSYTRLNPHARVPTIEHGPLVVYESAAICLYLSDLAPARLAPEHGSPDRPLLYQWLFFLSNTLQPALMSVHYPEKQAAGSECRRAVREHAERWAAELFARIDSELSARPFLLGRSVSVCDLFLLMLCRWGRHLTRPPRALPHLGRYLDTLIQRNAVRHAFDHEQLASPYV